MSSTEKIRELIEPLLAGAGLELWDVEVGRGVVRVLVERAGGIDLDGLARASKALSGFFDEHADLAPVEAYQLEVSSPGVERTLRTTEQYRRYLGALVSVKTKVAVEGQRRWRGTLLSADDRAVVLAPEGVETGEERLEVRLSHDQIDRARTVVVWGPGATSGRGTGRSGKSGGAARWSDPRGKGGARRAARSGAEVKEAQ